MFDSATTLQEALAAALHGHEFPMLGQFPGFIEPIADIALRGINRLPKRTREGIAVYGGVPGARSRRALAHLDADGLAQRVVDSYPDRQFPAVVIGATNGAVVHLAAALGVPWLPQTLMVPTRHLGTDPDDPRGAAADLTPAIRGLLDRNPDVLAYHHHDPNQDRVPTKGMAYVRLKWLRLPRPYRRFLETMLEPGGRVIIADCAWLHPSTELGERHIFQFTGIGGAEFSELFSGSERVAEFLAGHGSDRRKWEPPPPDTDRSEAEWGFHPALLDDLVGFAERTGHPLQALRYAEPEDPSPFVADLHRWWYSRRGLRHDRLLVDSFLVCDPVLTMRTGSTPYWAIFGLESSRRRLLDYLDSAEPYDEISVAMFSHFTDSIGMADGESWRAALGRARRRGRLIGFDPRFYPRDLRMVAGFHRELGALPGMQPLPGRLTLREVDEFAAGRNDPHVDWTELQP